MRRLVAALAGVFAVGVAPLVGSSEAAAADGEGYVTRYTVDLQVRRDGVLDVRERISYAFSGTGHGIVRFIPVRSRYDGTYDRIIEIDQVVVTSSTGAPVDLSRRNEGGYLRLRIGDPDRVVWGEQSYLIHYTAKGALDAFAGRDQVSWNAIGDRWDTSIGSATVTVSGPQLDRVTCVYGRTGSDRSCGTEDFADSTDGFVRRASFGPVGLDANEGMTVVVELPKGLVEVPAPVLVERWSVARAFSVTPLTGGIAVLLLMLGGAVVMALVRRGRDEIAVSRLAGGGVAFAGESTSVPVDWHAIGEMRPGLVGTLVDERAELTDVAATIVDLAVRGHLRIEEVSSGGFRGERDWRLVRLGRSADGLLPFEQRLLDALCPAGRSVRLAELGNREEFHGQLREVRSSFYEEVVRRGWYRTRPDRTRLIWYGIGAVAVAVTIGIGVALAKFTSYGLVGAALVVPAVALLAGARVMPVRTAAGSAALQQVLALRRYVETAEAQQLRWEDSHGLFSQLMPYAMIFGQAKRWVAAFRPLATTPQPDPLATGPQAGAFHPDWYDGMGDGLKLANFHSALTSFVDSVKSTMSTVSDSGSGSSGGGVGSGSGGGGGGGW
jgi:hypothetical protein